MNLLDRIAYDTGGYTVQEILSAFCKKILEIIDLVNKNEEVCEEVHTIIENIRNEVVPDLVDDLIKEMQDNGYFDNLVNVTLIEQLRSELTTLLNDAITDFTTRLDNFGSQLETCENKIENRTLKDKLCYKKIIHNLPLIFDDYYRVVADNRCEYIYPQSFAIDKNANELLILYSPDSSTVKAERWIVVYDLTSNEYKSCFSAGKGGGEGIEVLYEGLNRYLYVKSVNSSIGKYDITNLPSNMEILSPLQEFDTGLYYDFSYNNGKWLVEQSGTTLGSRVTRKVLSYFNEDFEQQGSVVTNTSDVGLWESSSKYMNRIPKRQGLALAGDVIYQATGGYWGAEMTDVIPFSYQGIKILNLNGELKEESLLDPSKMCNKFLTNGIGCSRIEYEGVKVVDNKLFSMIVVLGRYDTDASNEGVLIVEEMNEEGIDFTDCKAEYSPFNLEKINGMHPRTKQNGGLYNMVTGEKLSSLNDIIDYMIHTDLTNFNFYSSAVSISDLNNELIESGILVEIKNVNNTTLFMTFTGDNNKSKEFILYIVDGVYKQKEIANFSEYHLELLNGATPFYDGENVILKKDGAIVTISGMINNVPDGEITIANIPKMYRPRHNLTFAVALSGSTSGGYGTVVVKSNGDINVLYRSMDTEYICLNGISYVV